MSTVSQYVDRRTGVAIPRSSIGNAIVVLAALAGCASEQPQLVAARPASDATKAAPAAATATAPEAAAPETALEKARRAGYTARQVKGKTVWCRDELASGSRLQRKTVCVTDEQLQAEQAIAPHEASKMQRTRVPIVPGG